MAVLRSKEAFTAWSGGAPRVITVGQLVDDSDPIIKGREHLFETTEAHVAQQRERRAEVEQATAAPGEKRSVRRTPARGKKEGGQ